MERGIQRKQISNHAIELSYTVAKKVHHNELEKDFATEFLVNTAYMNKTSAKDYIYVFNKMMEGTEYKRTINQKATKFYLDGIKRDYGIEQLNIALQSVEKHVTYYEALGYGSLKSISKLVADYK